MSWFLPRFLGMFHRDMLLQTDTKKKRTFLLKRKIGESWQLVIIILLECCDQSMASYNKFKISMQ